MPLARIRLCETATWHLSTLGSCAKQASSPIRNISKSWRLPMPKKENSTLLLLPSSEPSLWLMLLDGAQGSLKGDWSCSGQKNRFGWILTGQSCVALLKVENSGDWYKTGLALLRGVLGRGLGCSAGGGSSEFPLGFRGCSGPRRYSGPGTPTRERSQRKAAHEIVQWPPQAHRDRTQNTPSPLHHACVPSAFCRCG